MAGRTRPRDEEAEPDPGAGTMLRPEAAILADETLIPRTNLVRPPPNRFTHELAVDEPYRLDRPERAGEPDGVLSAGTRVAVLVEDGERCRVVDGSGLYVEVRRTSLRELTK